jgi:hypothetical protein
MGLRLSGDKAAKGWVRCDPAPAGRGQARAGMDAGRERGWMRAGAGLSLGVRHHGQDDLGHRHR